MVDERYYVAFCAFYEALRGRGLSHDKADDEVREVLPKVWQALRVCERALRAPAYSQSSGRPGWN